MFERFTERARQVVVLAQDEARTLKHNYIGTEHILLGLLREQEGLAARVLDSLDITVEEVRAQVARIIGQGDEVTAGQIPFTPRAKKVLELALREALSLGHNYIGTEHILLGLVRENEGVAARILLDFDADAEKIRNEILRVLSPQTGRAARPADGPPDRALPELRRTGRVGRHQDGPGPLRRRGRRSTDVSPLRGRLAPQLPRGVEDRRGRGRVAHLCSLLVNPRRLSSRRRGQLAVALAAIAWSTAGLFQRELDVSTATQLAGRAGFALLALLGYLWLTERGNVVGAFRSIGIAGVGVAVCTAIASGSFIIALNHTSVAHVLFTQAISPVLAALLGWVVLREAVTGRTWAAMVIAVAGVAIMFGTPGDADVIGDGVSLLMSFAFAVAIVITRHRRDVSMIPAVCLSQVMVVCVAAPFAAPSTITRHDLAFLVLIGAFQMGVGLALFAAGARLINAAEVALITLLEVVLGPLWVWIAFSETPDTATLVGGLVVLVAVIVQVSGEVRMPVRLSATEAAPPPP